MVQGGFYLQLIECHYQNLQKYWDDVRYFKADWTYYYNFQPGASICIDGVRTDLVPGHFYLIAPGTTIHTRQSGHPYQFYASFKQGQPHIGARRPIYSFPVDQRLLDDMAFVISQYQEEGSMFTPQGSTRALALCAYALSHVSNAENESEFTDDRIERMVLQIRAYPQDNISIEEMARRCSLSRSVFIRRFRENTGQSPYAYLLNCRMQRACTLLETTDSSVEEIAAQLGYDDRFHFSKTFKRIINLSPVAYRRKKTNE